MYKPLDSRQISNRAVLQELFPYIGSQTLDVLLASINADLTPPLKVDASSTPNLVVNVGPAIVPNSESNRNKSISFINNVLPTFLSGTVTFPSANGGTITSSTGQTYTLNLPSGDYAQALLSLDTSGNLLVTVGTPNASLGSLVVPPPTANTLAFAYVTLHNLGGVVQNITQSQIFQLVGGGGSGGGGGGEAAEVALTVGTTSKVVTFGVPLAGNSYVVLAQIVNLVDANPEYIPVTITNKTNLGFTCSWNAPLPDNNYLLDYTASPGITQEQAGEAVLTLGSTSVTVTIPIPLSGTSYVVIGELVDTVDANPRYVPVTLTAKSSSSFTFSWNAPIETSSYRLAWQLAAYQ